MCVCVRMCACACVCVHVCVCVRVCACNSRVYVQINILQPIHSLHPIGYRCILCSEYHFLIVPVCFPLVNICLDVRIWYSMCTHMLVVYM